MKVGIFGANGKVGRLLCKHLKNSGKYQPLALLRKEEQLADFKQLGVDATVLSVEDASIETLSDAFKKHQVGAIVFTAGAGGKGGAERTLTVDLDGAVRSFEAAMAANVKRYIMVSAYGADQRAQWWGGPLQSYYIAKLHADNALRTFPLEWTILRPGALKEGDGTGKVADPTKAEHPSNGDQVHITRDDVASAIVASLNHPNSTVGKTFSLIQGEQDIEQALQGLK